MTSPARETRPARPADSVTVAAMVESIIGCKWSLQVLTLVRQGVTRPGAMGSSTAGLTTKVLYERLAKMIRFGILSRTNFPGVPLRVEYGLTPFGCRFLKILDAVDELQSTIPTHAAKPVAQPGRTRKLGPAHPRPARPAKRSS